MPFEIDQQTLQDLSLTDTYGQQSILQLFKPITLGGIVALKELSLCPLNDIDEITRRLDAIQFLANNKLSIQLHKEPVDFIEYYLKQSDRPLPPSRMRALKIQLNLWLKPAHQRYIIHRGLQLLLSLLFNITDELQRHSTVLPELLKEFNVCAANLISNIRPQFIQKLKAGTRFNASELEELDFLFRYSKNHEVKNFMIGIYQLDVFNSAAITANELKFTYPEFIITGHPELKLQGFFHPFVNNPISNDIAFTYNKNLCFITGANMAGKSTVLKTIGVCTYLAHIGFPVPAALMQTTVFNGLFTTINLSDNIVTGHSHFYQEVLRIKEVAVKVGTIKNILVIFDELFRGTNVKDAYDASLAIIKAFTEVKNSVFIISTHIVEVVDELKNSDNLFFNYLGTTMKSDKAIYSYKLQEGVSKERLGMQIIKDEGLIEIIRAQAK